MKSKRSDRGIAVGTDRGNIIFFDKLDHFFLLRIYIPLDIRPSGRKYFKGKGITALKKAGICSPSL